MKESFVFYDSFLTAIDELDSDTKLKVYEAVTHYALKGIEPELSGIAFAIFSLIKPQIDANNKKYENGIKGAGFGKLGGRPKKQKPQENPLGVISKNPKQTPNVNVNENDNVNVNDNDNVFIKKTDPFLNPIKETFLNEFEKQTGNCQKIRCNRKRHRFCRSSDCNVNSENY